MKILSKHSSCHRQVLLIVLSIVLSTLAAPSPTSELSPTTSQISKKPLKNPNKNRKHMEKSKTKMSFTPEDALSTQTTWPESLVHFNENSQGPREFLATTDSAKKYDEIDLTENNEANKYVSDVYEYDNKKSIEAQKLKLLSHSMGIYTRMVPTEKSVIDISTNSYFLNTASILEHDILNHARDSEDNDKHKLNLENDFSSTESFVAFDVTSIEPMTTMLNGNSVTTFDSLQKHTQSVHDSTSSLMGDGRDALVESLTSHLENKKPKTKESKKKLKLQANKKTTTKINKKVVNEVHPQTISEYSTTNITPLKIAPTTLKSTTLMLINPKTVIDTVTPTIGPETENERSLMKEILDIKLTTISTLHNEFVLSTANPNLFKDSLATSQAYSNVSETGESVPPTQEVAFNEQRHNRNDNIIILNTNSSGLIVVDILENFEKAVNSSTEDEGGFEIKMDLIDDSVENMGVNALAEKTNGKHVDDIFLTTESTVSEESSSIRNIGQKTVFSTHDDIILINDNADVLSEVKSNDSETFHLNENVKIKFDNVELPSQRVNLTIQNGELVIDNINIGLMSSSEESNIKTNNLNANETANSKNESLDIILIEDDTVVQTNSNYTNMPTNNFNSEANSFVLTTAASVEATTKAVKNDNINDSSAAKLNGNNKENHNNFPTTIQIELPNQHGGKQNVNDDEDEIKIKTTDKDSETIFYISNTEVKVIEPVPTKSPYYNQFLPAIYEEDVVIDFNDKNNSGRFMSQDKYEEDIVLSPLTNDFDPLKDINYIGEAFLDVEESQNGGYFENHHIIPLTSDVVIQPVELQGEPESMQEDIPIGVPIINELPPQIELEEMVVNEENNGGEQSSFKNIEYYPHFLNNRLVKNHLSAEVPKKSQLSLKNDTLWKNRTMNSINTNINGTKIDNGTLANSTAFLVENDEVIDDLNDLQTLFLACLATLAPLILSVIVAFSIRHFWKRYRRQSAMGNDLISDKSTDPLAEKNRTDELKSTESGLSINRSNENLVGSTELLTATESSNHHTNGSIITMTLKNNHLIVETEERNDISRDTRETKMHYSPSEKDGVFIVEAARGADQNGGYNSSKVQKVPLKDVVSSEVTATGDIKIDSLQNNYAPSSPEEEQKLAKPQKVQVHNPPASLNLIDEAHQNGTQTGLSQSDLSLTSSNSSNHGYTYGSHEPYQFDEKGYKGSSPKRIINLHCHNDLQPLIENSPPFSDPNKPIIKSAIYKDEIPDMVKDAYAEGGQPLKSDVQAFECNEKRIKEANCKEHQKVGNGIIPTLKDNIDIIESIPDHIESIMQAPIAKIDYNGESTLDSLSFLPPPPLDDQTIVNISENMDSLPPPPTELIVTGGHNGVNES